MSSPASDPLGGCNRTAAIELYQELADAGPNPGVLRAQPIEVDFDFEYFITELEENKNPEYCEGSEDAFSRFDKEIDEEQFKFFLKTLEGASINGKFVGELDKHWYGQSGGFE